MVNSTFDGGCSCGHVRYRMTSDPLIVHGCHCRVCQRQTGTSFAQNALIESDRVELLHGDVELTLMESPSGAGQKIARCPKCHVALWSNYLMIKVGNGEAIRFVRVGTLDTPDKLPPDVHIHTLTKQPWVTLGSNVPVFEKSYVASETWSNESQKRSSTLMEKFS